MLRAPHSVRSYVVGLILVVLLPLLVFSGFLVLRSAEHEQDLMASGVRNRTRAAAVAIEGELGNFRAKLFIIAGGISQQPTELAEFQKRAAEAFPAMLLVLSDPTGQEVVNTEVPFGSELPKNADDESLRWVEATERPYIGNLTVEPLSHRPAAMLSVPVMHNGKMLYVLSLDVLPVLSDLLTHLDLPSGWIATVADRNGTTIGRNHDAARYIGQPGRPQFVLNIHTKLDGWFPGVSREGVPLYNAFEHIQTGQWTVLIGIPRDALYAPVHQSTAFLSLLGAATLILAVVLASLIGKRIAMPVTELVPMAEAVGRGEVTGVRVTWLSEANAVACSLFEAGRRLREAAAEREAAVEALQHSERQYRAVAEDLARVNQERTELLLRTIAAQEDERTRIARELHDGLAQYLTALRLGIDALGPPGPPCSNGARVVAGLKSITGELGRAVNRMAWELRPVPLDELGLPAAVAHYLDEWAERSQLEVDVEVKLGERQLPEAVEATLFRVLQEAMTNVLKHAGASHVGVIVEAAGEEVRLIVEDNGKGIPRGHDSRSDPRDAGHTGHTGISPLGLLGMRERLALVRGTLEIESAPATGTTLFVRIPT